MKSASRFTGLIMVLAPREKASEALAGTISTLGEFQLTIISSDSIEVRDRFIATILVELHPDHTEALESDLNATAAKLGIDIATEFVAYTSESTEGSRENVVIASSGLKSSHLSGLLSAITDSGLTPISLRSSEGVSLEVTTRGDAENHVALREAVKAFSASTGIAAGVVRRSAERKLIVLDMDSTIINEEVIDQLATKAGTGEKVSKITESAMRGEIDFAQSLNERVATLAGLSNSALDEVRLSLTLTEGVEDFVKSTHEAGHLVAVVSGGFHNVIDPLLKDLGVDYILANTLETTPDGLTGRVVGPIVDAKRKAEFLAEIAAKREISIENTVAIGDGANDREMLALAGIGIAFCAKPALKEVADIVLDERNLALVLPLLGL